MIRWREDFQSARRLDYRHCLLLAGSFPWCQQEAIDVVSQALPSLSMPLLWLGDDPPQTDRLSLESLSPHDSRSLLGRDSDCIVMDLWTGFNVDTLGRAVGALNGGGLLLLLSPPLASWDSYDDPDYARHRATRPNPYRFHGYFLRRLRRLFQENLRRESGGCVSLLEQPGDDLFSSENPATDPLLPVAQRSPRAAAGDFIATLAQRDLMQGVADLMLSPRAALCLVADRGRGKSVALGLSIAALISTCPLRVVVTSPLRENVRNLFSAIGEVHASVVSYLPVDQLLLESSVSAANVDLLIVDEAAAIPIPVLDKLSSRYQRLVFSSTVHGYEGSGRGFSLRFKYLLGQRFSVLKYSSLKDPLRWASGDPLEYFFNDMLFLDSGSPTDNDWDGSIRSREIAAPSTTLAAVGVKLRWVEAKDLLADESLLKRVFALLSQAHYQTRPSDLRYLLDVPYVKLLIAECAVLSHTVVGVLLLCEEGDFSRDQYELIDSIVRSERRPRGNLLAQLLANQSADGDWCRARSWRVMRIAVQEGRRRQGVASMLLSEMEREAQQDGCDYWGTSFGFDRQLLSFWVARGALPLSLGLHLDRASGARNIMLVAPLNTPTRHRAEHLLSSLQHDWTFWAARYWTEFDEQDIAVLQSILVRPLSSRGDNTDQLCQSQLVNADDQQVERFLAGEIGYDRVYPALCRWLPTVCVGVDLSRASVSQAPDWGALAEKYGLSGRRAVIAAIKTELIDARTD